MSPDLKDKYKLGPCSPAPNGHPDKDWYDTQNKYDLQPVDMRDPRGYFRLSCYQFKKIDGNEHIPLYHSKILLDTDNWKVITSQEIVEKLKIANDDYHKVLRESIANLPTGQALHDTLDFPVDEFATHDIEFNQQQNELDSKNLRIVLKLYLSKGHKTSITRDYIKPQPTCKDPLTSPDHFPTYVYIEYDIRTTPPTFPVKHGCRGGNNADAQLVLRSRIGIVYENWIEMITNHAPKMIEDTEKKVEEYHYLHEKKMRENPNGEAPPFKKSK